MKLLDTRALTVAVFCVISVVNWPVLGVMLPTAVVLRLCASSTPPTCTSPAIPAPPATTNAPLNALVDAVVLVTEMLPVHVAPETNRLFPVAIPPVTTNAPVVELVVVLADVKRTEPVAFSDSVLIALLEVMALPVMVLLLTMLPPVI